MTQAEVMEIALQLPSGVKIKHVENFRVNRGAYVVRRLDMTLYLHTAEMHVRPPDLPDRLHYQGRKYGRSMHAKFSWGSLTKNQDGTYYRQAYPVYIEVPA